MARRGVPFAGRAEAGIDVGATLGDDAEFEAGANRDMIAQADRLIEIIGGGLVIMRF